MSFSLPALHLPARALAIISDFLRVEFDVVLVDIGRPFATDGPTKVLCHRLNLGVTGSTKRDLGPITPLRYATVDNITMYGLVTSARVLSGMSTTIGAAGCTALATSVSRQFSVSPSYPLCMLGFSNRADGRSSSIRPSTRADVALAFPFAATEPARITTASDNDSTELRSALGALGGCCFHGEARGGVMTAPEWSLPCRPHEQTLTLWSVEICPSSGVPRVLRRTPVALGSSSAGDMQHRSLCDGAHTYVAYYEHSAKLTGLKLCSSTGNVAASVTVDMRSEDSELIALLPDLWLATGAGMSLVSTSAPPRPQTRFEDSLRRGFGAADPSLRVPITSAWAVVGNASTSTSTSTSTSPFYSARFVIHSHDDIRGGRMLLAGLNTAGDLVLLDETRDPGVFSYLRSGDCVLEDPTSDSVVLRMQYGNSLVLTATRSNRLGHRAVSGICVAPRSSAPAPAYHQVHRQILRQQEERVRSRGGAAHMASPPAGVVQPATAGAATPPKVLIDLTCDDDDEEES